jgi:hypothetical protein
LKKKERTIPSRQPGGARSPAVRRRPGGGAPFISCFDGIGYRCYCTARCYGCQHGRYGIAVVLHCCSLGGRCESVPWVCATISASSTTSAVGPHRNPGQEFQFKTVHFRLQTELIRSIVIITCTMQFISSPADGAGRRGLASMRLLACLSRGVAIDPL